VRARKTLVALWRCSRLAAPLTLLHLKRWTRFCRAAVAARAAKKETLRRRRSALASSQTRRLRPQRAAATR
jgi:hypothetical protein